VFAFIGEDAPERPRRALEERFHACEVRESTLPLRDELGMRWRPPSDLPATLRAGAAPERPKSESQVIAVSHLMKAMPPRLPPFSHGSSGASRRSSGVWCQQFVKLRVCQRRLKSDPPSAVEN
jgi:hypothetical protein